MTIVDFKNTLAELNPHLTNQTQLSDDSQIIACVQGLRIAVSAKADAEVVSLPVENGFAELIRNAAQEGRISSAHEKIGYADSFLTVAEALVEDKAILANPKYRQSVLQIVKSVFDLMDSL